MTGPSPADPAAAPRDEAAGTAEKAEDRWLARPWR
jgi:hypothetical protein